MIFSRRCTSRPIQVVSPRRRLSAFTLIELLTVVAIIGILAAIIIPTAGGARKSANRAKVRAQFGAWTSAFEAFRQEYGAYPQLSATGAQKLVNPLGTSTNAQQVHLFHDILTGRRRDPAAVWPTTTAGTPPPPQVQNSRRIQFVNFVENDFVSQADVTAGRAAANQLNFVRDAFYNTSIACVTDSNLNSVINGSDTAGGFPPVTVAGGTTVIRVSAATLPVGTTGGVHAGVIFYSAPPGSTTEADLILSWK